jgi:hypothetical protein
MGLRMRSWMLHLEILRQTLLMGVSALELWMLSNWFMPEQQQVTWCSND